MKIELELNERGTPLSRKKNSFCYEDPSFVAYYEIEPDFVVCMRIDVYIPALDIWVAANDYLEKRDTLRASIENSVVEQYHILCEEKGLA